MEIISYPASKVIKLEILHIEVDELVNLINTTMNLAIPFPQDGCGIEARDGQTCAVGGWGIYIQTDIADGNPGFAKLIVVLADRESWE